MTPLFVWLAAFVPLLAYAHSDSPPVVAWASHRSKILDGLPSAVTRPDHFQSILETILFNDDVCRHNAVVLVNHPGLKASHLRRLDQHAPLVRRITSAASSIQFPYTRSSISDLPIKDLADIVSHRCGAQMIKMQPNEGILSNPDNKYVVLVTLDPFDSPATFANVMEKVATVFPNHLIIYTSESPLFVRRQLGDTPDSGSLFSAPNNTMADAGILKRYQLLTPGLILTLILVFFVFVPVIALGINALASLQSPTQTETPRSFNAKDKKNQ